MIRRLPWHKVPSAPVLEALPSIKWSSPAEGRSAATETAALMLYVALIFMSQAPEWPEGGTQEADATYDELALATGLSRAMIAGGIARLIALKLIAATGNRQRRRYEILSRPAAPSPSSGRALVTTAATSSTPVLPSPAYTPWQAVPSLANHPAAHAWPAHGVQAQQLTPDLQTSLTAAREAQAAQANPFFKLPCRAIVEGQVIMPFSHFLLRSKYEMYALKLYLYLAARRKNNSLEALSNYDTIAAATGIPRRDIRKAINLLNTVELLRSVDRRSAGEGFYENSPNLYYLKGCEDLINRKQVAAPGALAAVRAASAAVA